MPGATWVLTGVNEQLNNIAAQKISGVDVDVRYGFKMGAWGDMDLSAIATFYDEAKLTPRAGAAAIDLLVQAGGSTSDQGYVKFTAAANATWR